MTDDQERLMRYAANKAGEREFFLAHSLESYGFSRAEMCQLLNITEADYDRLALCRKPSTIEEVRQIAERFGIDASTLARIVATKTTRGKDRET